MDEFFKIYDWLRGIDINPFLSSPRNRYLLLSATAVFLVLGFQFQNIKITDMNIFTSIGIFGIFIFALSTVMAIFAEHKISELTGSWRTVRGNGIILAPNNPFEVRNICVNASLLAGSDDRTLTVDASADWDIYQADFFIRTISMKFDGKTAEIQRLNLNTWRYVSPNFENKITLSLKSANTAEVLEEGHFELNGVILPYRVSYLLAKK